MRDGTPQSAGTETKIQSEHRREVFAAIEDDYTRFISGFAVGTDLMFAEIVAELKGSYPIKLEAARPYPGRMKMPDTDFQWLIAVYDGRGTGGTAATVRYARAKGRMIKIINV